MNASDIRKDFSLLAGGKPPIYFDNACVSLRPESVIKAIGEYYREYPVCAGRSNHRLGDLLSQKIEQARKMAADFINAKSSDEIIFTRNSTEGINLIANGLDFKKDDVVLISDKEHNSNLIPWQTLREKKQIKLDVTSSQQDNTFDLDQFKKKIKPEVKLVSVVFVSNLDGVENPIEEIVKISHLNGSLVLTDAAQAAGHQKIDVQAIGCDFLVFSGHKMLGPSGIGCLYIKKELMRQINPLIVGGGTVVDSTYESHEFLEGPGRFEAGLQNYAGIVGLAKAIEYIQSIGFENIKKQEEKVNRFISEKLKKMERIKLIGPLDFKKRNNILNFYIDAADSHDISLLLDKTYNIMARSGRHCVHSWYNGHNIKNSVRLSFYFYNTEKEAEYFTDSMEKIINII